jgi:quinol monooxygenase YgiN
MNHKTARFEVRPEGLEKCRQAIREFVTHIRQNEPDTKLYLSLESSDKPGSFLHVMMFADDAAEQRHAQSDACRRFTGILYPELSPAGSSPEFKAYTALASNRS